MAFNKTFEYSAAVRRYHYFKAIRQPKENEVLVCKFKNGNGQRGTMVGYLPCKVSRITRFIIDRGVTVSTMLIRTHCKYSLVKGGL